MRELGASAGERTRRSEAAAAAQLDALYVLGPHAERVRSGAEAAGLPAERIVVAAEPRGARAQLHAAPPRRRRAAPQGLARGGHGAGSPRTAGAPRRGESLVMLYALLYPYHESIAPLNVFRYITFRTLVAGLTALTLSLLLGPRSSGVSRRCRSGSRSAPTAGDAPREGGHADDGRHADPLLGDPRHHHARRPRRLVRWDGARP
jgi:hypothetical protein